jgi:hypothetical protein
LAAVFKVPAGDQPYSPQTIMDLVNQLDTYPVPPAISRAFPFRSVHEAVLPWW